MVLNGLIVGDRLKSGGVRMERIVSPDTRRENRIPPGQHQVKSWPALHYGSVPKLDKTKWTFFISGLVDKERKLTFEEFAALPQVEVFSDIHCVTSWSLLDNLWQGVSTSVIKDLVSVKSSARYVMVHGSPNFTTNLPLADFFESDVLFAMMRNGDVLEPAHGAPVRLIVPCLYFWKSAKWVTGLRFMEKDKAGFWESNGYHMHGDPWKEERYS